MIKTFLKMFRSKKRKHDVESTTNHPGNESTTDHPDDDLTTKPSDNDLTADYSGNDLTSDHPDNDLTIDRPDNDWRSDRSDDDLIQGSVYQRIPGTTNLVMDSAKYATSLTSTRCSP